MVVVIALLMGMLPAVAGESELPEGAEPTSDTGTGTPTQCEEGSIPPNCDPGVYTWVWVSGIVTNAFGDPLEGATVTSESDSDVTGPTGTYTIEVQTNDKVQITAWKTGYETRVKVVDPYEASLLGVNFTLPYFLTLSVTPELFTSTPRVLDISVNTTAPVSGSKVWADMPDGTQVILSPDSTTYGLWTGSWTAGSSLVEGHYHAKACAVDSGASGSCSSVTGLRLSDLKLDRFTFDGTSPVISDLTPLPNHNTLDTTPTIRAIVSDATSGVVTSSITIDLDGVRVASGVSSYTPASALSLGVHTVTVTASDLAGNVSSVSWEFNLAALTAQSVPADLFQMTVDVNPAGDVVPPESVTFEGVTATLGAYRLSLSSSPRWAGWGEFGRQVIFDELEVTFVNEAGLTEVVAAPVRSAGFTDMAAVLAPTDQQVEAQIPALTVVLSSITVEVPLGFGMEGSRATLSSVSAELAGPVTTGTDDPLPNAFGPGTYSIEGGYAGTDPYAEAKFFSTADGPAVATASMAPRLHYPCTSTTSCVLQILGASVDAPKPSEPTGFDVDIKCDAPTCAKIMGGSHQIDLVWYVPGEQDADPYSTTSVFTIWQKVWAYGASGTSDPVTAPSDILLWQNSVAEAPSSVETCEKFTVLSLDNLTQSRSTWLRTIPSEGESLFAPTYDSPDSITLTLKGKGPTGSYIYDSSTEIRPGLYGGTFDNPSPFGQLFGSSNRWEAMDTDGNGSIDLHETSTDVRLATGTVYRKGADQDHLLAAGMAFTIAFTPRCS